MAKLKRLTVKNNGRILLFLIGVFLFIISLPVYSAEISSELNRTSLSPGESAVLKIMISGETSDITPVKVPAVKGLKISYTGSSKSFQFVNGNVWSGIILNFSVFAEKSGSYKIPPFVIKAGGVELQSEALTLLVREGASPERRVSSVYMRGGIELSSAQVYAGEPLVMRYFVYLSGNRALRIEGFREQPHVKGFILTGIDEKIPPSIEISEGLEYEKIHAATFLLTPAGEGEYSVGGGSIVVTVEGGRGFFSFPDQKLLSMPQSNIKVLPIPLKGAPPGFRGALGDFGMEIDFNTEEASLFEEVKLGVIIRGRGNLQSLHHPIVDGMDGVRVLIEDEPPDFNLNEDIPEGSKRYSLTLVPEKQGYVNGSLSLPVYNPYSGEYNILKSDPISFDVKEGNSVSIGESKIVPVDKEGSSALNYILIISFIIISSAAGLYLFMRDRKIFRHIKRGGDTNAADIIPDSKPVSDDRGILLNELGISFNKRDREGFLRNALKLIETADSVRDDPDFITARDQVYLCRYAGSPLSDDDMRKIFNLLKGIF